MFQWIGLRENLQETIDFPIKSGAKFSLKPIHSMFDLDVAMWHGMLINILNVIKKKWIQSTKMAMSWDLTWFNQHKMGFLGISSGDIIWYNGIIMLVMMNTWRFP